MHANIRHLSKPKLQFCHKCVADAYKKSQNELNEINEDIILSIKKTESIENDLVTRLHKISSMIEQSNNLIN